MNVAHGPPADAEHQPAVSPDQLLERRLVALFGEPGQEGAVVERDKRVRQSDAGGHRHGLAGSLYRYHVRPRRAALTKIGADPTGIPDPLEHRFGLTIQKCACEVLHEPRK
jgi:hypothetical protein